MEDHETGADEPRPSLQGRSLIVDATSGDVEITAEDGAPLPEKARKEIAGHYRRLGKPDLLRSALPRGPLRRGERVRSLEQAIRQAVEEADEKEAILDDVSVAFTGTEWIDGKQVAKFDFSVSVRTPLEPFLTASTQRRGTMCYRLEDGREVADDGVATTTLSPSDDAPPTLSVSGSGREKVVRRQRYELP